MKSFCERNKDLIEMKRYLLEKNPENTRSSIFMQNIYEKYLGKNKKYYYSQIVFYYDK